MIIESRVKVKLALKNVIIKHLHLKFCKIINY